MRRDKATKRSAVAQPSGIYYSAGPCNYVTHDGVTSSRSHTCRSRVRARYSRRRSRSCIVRDTGRQAGLITSAGVRVPNWQRVTYLLMASSPSRRAPRIKSQRLGEAEERKRPDAARKRGNAAGIARLPVREMKRSSEKNDVLC